MNLEMTLFNLIVIEGGYYNDIKKALEQWINLTDALLNELTFKLYKNGSCKYLIQTDERLSNEHFYSLVNYLNYPEDIEYKIDIKGFTIGTDNNILKNKKLLVFIPPTDVEFDNIYVVTSENENYQIDFNGKIKKSRERQIYRQPTGLTFGNPAILKVQKKREYLTEKQKNKILKIILFFIFVLLSTSAFSIFVIKNLEFAYFVYNIFLVLMIILAITSIVRIVMGKDE
jgi:hypothetical protein